jgi:beta-glucosidase
MALGRFFLAAIATSVVAWHSQAYMNDSEINNLIKQMTLEEKVKLLGGNDFETFAIPRLHIPALKMTDGPLGVHFERGTAFPAGIAYAATFDPKLIHEMAIAMADEARSKGRHMLLGPCVNISRNPFGGRNFESYGEDPYLSGRIAEEWVNGVQSRNILTSVKHFAVNDQEYERMSINVKVDPRALFEIHLPAFKRAIDAGAWSVMAAYNKVNGFFASENNDLLNKILKGMWKYKGLVVSDWGATHSTLNSANHGLDLEMPFGEFFNAKLVNAVQQGLVNLATIDDKVRRLLRAMAAIDLIGPPAAIRIPPATGPESQGHMNLARKVASESAVLLKNVGGLLPLKRTLRSIAILGPNASTLRTGGGGSSHVDPYRITTPLDGIKEFLGTGASLNHAIGVAGPGEPSVGAGGMNDAVQAARTSEVAVIFAGVSDKIEGEGVDRTSIDLPAGQEELINAVAAVNPNTIVVLTSGNPLAMANWIGDVKSVIHFWYPGQEGGRAIADVLFGLVNPSGKLPVTFLKQWEDSPAYGNYPGADDIVEYKEGIFVGYRHFDAKAIAPEFPFGFGLSYTQFNFSNLRIKIVDRRSDSAKVRATFEVRNVGLVAGAEVAQIYVGERKPSLPRPVRELKGFSKVYLQPGQIQTVSIDLDASAFSYFDSKAMIYRANGGDYSLEVGNSSRHLLLKKIIRLN